MKRSGPKPFKEEDLAVSTRFYLKPGEFERLKRLAATKGMKPSPFIRSLVQQAIKDEQAATP